MKKTILLLFILLFSIASFGADDTYQEDYDFTYKYCSDYHVTDALKMALHSWKDAYLVYRLFKVNKKLDRLLSGQGYYDAVMACFPNSQTDRDLFFASLLAADIAGKAGAGILMATNIKFGAKGLMALKVKSIGLYRTAIAGTYAFTGVQIKLIYDEYTDWFKSLLVHRDEDEDGAYDTDWVSP